MGVRVITTTWVDTNKGSEEEPNYRSRLVGRELNFSDRPDLFAATPRWKVSDISSADVLRLKPCEGRIALWQLTSAGHTFMPTQFVLSS